MKAVVMFDDGNINKWYYDQNITRSNKKTGPCLNLLVICNLNQNSYQFFEKLLKNISLEKWI